MIRYWNLTLVLLLGLQLGLLFVAGKDKTATTLEAERPGLLALDRKAISELTIVDDMGFELAVKAEADGWLLSSYHALPVDEAQLGLFLDALASWKPGFVYGTRPEDHEHFQVSADNFRFRVKVRDQRGQNHVFYLGVDDTAPAGAATYYYRHHDASEVYQVSFAGFTPSALPHIWLDTALLALSEELQQIEGPGFSLLYRDNLWQLADLNANEQQDFVQVVGLVSTLGGIRVLGKLEDPKLEAGLASRQPDFAYTVTSVSGASERYDFYRASQRTYVRSTRYPHFFLFSEKTAKLLAGLQRAAFLQQ